MRATTVLIFLVLASPPQAVLAQPGPPVWMPTAGPEGGIIEDLASDGRGTVLAATWWSGLFLSKDGGRTWFETGSELSARAFASAAVSPDGYLFAAMPHDSGGVFRSIDDGLSWRAVNS